MRVLLGALLCASLFATTAAARPVTVTIYRVVQLKPDFDLSTPGDFYSRMTIDGTTVRSSEHSDDCTFCGYLFPWALQLPAPWVLTQNVPDSATSATLTIEIIDSDYPDPDNGADLNPRADKRVLGLNVDLATGRWTGDVNWPQNCTSGDYSEEHAVEICFDVSAISAEGDADEDGLLDSWEALGYNDDGDMDVDVDLPALGASPLRKDIFVEIDCLVAATHSHCPSEAAIAQAARSFADAPVDNLDGTSGVQLHVDLGTLLGTTRPPEQINGAGGVTSNYGNLGSGNPKAGGNAIPEAGNEVILSFDAPQSESGTRVADLRSDYFDSRRAEIFRYGIFGHKTNPASRCISGNALLPGDSFLVTLGGNRTSGGTVTPCWGTDGNGNSVGSINEQTGAFMHELGHTLGLTHDGDQKAFDGGQEIEVHNKPNYLSVMNYAWNFCGLPVNADGGLPWMCDYSRARLPTLDETFLDECAGRDSGVHGLGPWNWNGFGLSGATCLPPDDSVNVEADINRDGVCVRPGVDGILSTKPAAGSDDVLDDETIFDGPDRECDTLAAQGDEQVTAFLATPEQPDQLNGYNDWQNLEYGLGFFYRGNSSSGANGPAVAEPALEELASARAYQALISLPDIVIDLQGPATGQPGDTLNYTATISNEGRGPAVSAALTHTAPDGSEQTSDLGIVTLGSSLTSSTSFTVPDDACPGDYTSSGVAVAFLDIVGNELQSSGSLALEVLDVAAPAITVAVSPAVLWSPDHKFRQIAAAITVDDNCDASPAVTLLSITSNEPEADFLGTGDKGPDVRGATFGTDDRNFALRAERATGGASLGRFYTITYQAADRAGNTSVATAQVLVPTDATEVP